MDKVLQHKLQQYAPPPPEGTWDRIEAALNEESTLLGTRLHAYEEVPAPANWKAIEGRLGTPVRRMATSKIIRWVAAAVAIGIILFTGIRVFDNEPQTPSVVINGNALPSTPVTGFQEETASGAPAGEGAIASASPQRAVAAGSYTARERNKGRIAAASSLAARGLLENFIPRHAEPKPVIAEKPAQDKYMVYSDDLGNAVKMPKKLFDFFACVAEDIACKKQLQNMQQKFAATGFNTDFLGVMEMLQGLKENQ